MLELLYHHAKFGGARISPTLKELLRFRFLTKTRYINPLLLDAFGIVHFLPEQKRSKIARLSPLPKRCGYWTTRGYANSRIANSRTGRLADWTSRRLVNSRTRQLAYWTSRGLDNSRMPSATLRA